MIMPAMVRVYASLVVNGRRTIESVPTEYQEAVKAEIAKQ